MSYNSLQRGTRHRHHSSTAKGHSSSPHSKTSKGHTRGISVPVDECMPWMTYGIVSTAAEMQSFRDQYMQLPMEAEIPVLGAAFSYPQPSDMDLHIDDAAIYQQLEEALDMELLDNSTLPAFDKHGQWVDQLNFLDCRGHSGLIEELMMESLSSETASETEVLSDDTPMCWNHGCNGKIFSSWSNLRRHQREKAGKAPKSYCPQCGAYFSRSTARNQHMANMSCTRIRRYSNGRERPSIVARQRA